jgi:two-component system chemotaxis sensor kinase CheA
MLSLGAKLALATVAVLLLVSIVVFGVLTWAARRALLDDKTRSAALVADLFAASATASLDFGDDKDVAHEVQNLRVDRDISYAAVWRAGSARPVAVFGDPGQWPLPSPELIAHAESRLLPDSIEEARRIERPDGTPVGEAVMRFSLAPERAAITRAQRGIFYGTATTLWLTALLILGVTRVQIVRPLARLADAARRLEAGDRAVQVKVASNDEVGQLVAVFNTMSHAIVDREEHLAEAGAQQRELIDHMHQGIVVFGADGIARKAPSKQASVIFGPEVEGQAVLDLLYAGAPPDGPEEQAFEAWLSCAFEVPASAWDEVAGLAPVHAERTRDGTRQWLDLQWSPVFKNDRVDRIMLLASDVTRERELERDVAAREEQHAREIRAMRRLLAGGGQVFATFLETAAARLDDLARTVRDSTALDTRLGDLLVRAHTLHGEARTFELTELASACQAIERAVRDAQNDPAKLDATWRAKLLELSETAGASVAGARELFVEASPIGHAVLDQMTVRRSDVRELGLRISDVAPDARRLIVALSSRPFGECVIGLDAAAARWAEESGKQAELVVEGRDARVPGEIARALTAVLPHLVRNAIAHGIEMPTARREAKKQARGNIRIVAVEQPLSIRVSDDGAGLDDVAIRVRAGALGLETAPTTELVLADGLSTFASPTELAGYGVGLSAVSRDLDAVGCSVQIRSEPGKGLEVSVFVRRGM